MTCATKVLVVDDSAFVRRVLSRGLNSDPEIEVIDTAGNPYEARDKIVRLKPDVLTLDIEMPRMDGIEFLRRLIPQHPIPVVVVSSLAQERTQAALEALAAGAVDVVGKPTSDLVGGLSTVLTELRAKVKAAAHATPRPRPTAHGARAPKVNGKPLANSTDKVIAIGASTGGTEALRTVLSEFRPDMPGTIIVQHMPGTFTETFAKRLDEQCAIEVRQARDGERLRTGLALIAPGGVQCRVKRSGGQYHVILGEEDRVSGHAPSVDVLMSSMAKNVGPNGVGVILTGMGADGADGMLHMHNSVGIYIGPRSGDVGRFWDAQSCY